MGDKQRESCGNANVNSSFPTCITYIWKYMGAQIRIYVYLPICVYIQKYVWVYNMHVCELCPLKESKSKKTPGTVNTPTGQSLGI